MNESYFRTFSEPLTLQEEFYQLLPESARVKSGQLITMADQMNIEMQHEIARDKLREKYESEDEDGDEDYDDYY